MAKEKKPTKSDEEIISEMRKVRKQKPVLDKELENLSEECKTAREEFKKLLKDVSTVMRETDKIIKITEDKFKEEKKKKSTNFNENNIKTWIEQALIKKGIIDEKKE